MLLRNLNLADQAGSNASQELAEGLPTIAALARLCGHAISGEIAPVSELTREALAIIAASQGYGTFDIRGDQDAFETADRFLAVCVEIGAERRLLFRDKSQPRQTLLFLDGFRQLCQSGLVLHHLQKDFSLTTAGFELSDQLNRQDFQELIAFATEIEH